MAFLQITIFSLLSRLWGHDFNQKISFEKTLAVIGVALLFFPFEDAAARDWLLLGIVTSGFWLGNMMRDSLLDIVRADRTEEQKWDQAKRMTIRAGYFLPLMLGVYLAVNGLNLKWELLLCLAPFTRAPIQFACDKLNLPESSDALIDRRWWVHFFFTQAAQYEIWWSTAMAASIVRMVYG